MCIQYNIHDADALQTGNTKAKVFAHAANLSVEALCEDDAKGVLSDLFNETGARNRIENGNALRHFANEFVVDRFIDRHDVFLLVVVSCTQDLVHDITVAGEQYKPLTGLIESAHWKNALGVAYEIDDVVFLESIVGRAHNAHGLVEGDVHMGIAGGANGLAITRTSSPSFTFVPISGTLPLMVTRPSSMSASAALREQKPTSERYLLMRVSNGCEGI